MNQVFEKRRGLGHWPDSYGVGMKSALNPPPYLAEPERDWADQALLDMARRDPGPPVYPFEYFEKICRRDARNATVKAGLFLGAVYAGAFIIWGTSWL